MLGFVGLILVVVGLIHFYLWKRLVKDPLPRGRTRRIGTAVIVVLAVLIPVTLVGSRSGSITWQAWPGYMWLALMFYLLVTLVLLEIPRLVLLLMWRPKKATVTAAASGPARIRPLRDDGQGSADDGQGSADDGQGSADDGQGSADDGQGSAKEAAAAQGIAGSEPDTDRPSSTGPGSTGPSAEPSNPRPSNPGPGNIGPSNSGPGNSGPSAGPGSASAERGSAEPADGGPGIDRRLLLARGAAIFAGLTAAGVTGYGVKTALGGPRLDRIQLPMAKLPRAMDGTRLAVVSDIHLGPLTGVGHATRIVDLINTVNADIVCVVGDLVDGSVAELGRLAAPLADIQSRHGAYFVTGNHEYYSGYAEWIEEVARLEVRPLRNERIEIDGLDLAGVNDLGGAEVGDGPDFTRALGDRDTARPVVLMAHQPVAAVDAAPFGVDLQVSGHTHGGQMAPFNLLVKLEQPVVSGLGTVDGVPVYVTNGAGWWGPPVRVGAPPQVSVIELRSA